jgi:hypothetical protein
MQMSEVRVTQKSRLVAEMSEALTELYDAGNCAPTKSEIITGAAARSLSDGASPVMKILLETEIANALDKYFQEVCDSASRQLGLQYHYTSRQFYKDKRRIPSSFVEAQAYVVCFGNGRRGSAEGVRFVTKEDEPDPLMAVFTQKSVDVINAAIRTQLTKVKAVLDSGVLGESESLRLGQLMPRVLTKQHEGRLNEPA